MGRFFGTDGIRGKTNQFPMTAELAMDLGRAIAVFFSRKGQPAKIIVGKDTRISGDMFESGLCAGICSMGADAVKVGVIPTPAVAFLTRQSSADAGVMISASHNPFFDNGLKVFQADGFKLTDDIQDRIETIMSAEPTSNLSKDVEQTGRVDIMDEAGQRYMAFLKECLPEDFFLSGMKIVIDCANGATYKIAPALFSALGATIVPLFNQPDGININENCGSEHIESLRKKVVDTGADIGLAFDGDGDRLIAVDEKGLALTGDQFMAILARFMKQKGELKNDLVVSTVMSNIGLKKALEKLGVKNARSKVGDRYVLEMMREKDAVFGGEDSGHIIFAEHHTTGDGLLAALKLLQCMTAEGKPLSELSQFMEVFPQSLINVEVPEKPAIETLPDVVKEISEVEKLLKDSGRVLVRYSGTEPVCRVMVEGPTREKTLQYAQRIAQAMEKTRK